MNLSVRWRVWIVLVALVIFQFSILDMGGHTSPSFSESLGPGQETVLLVDPGPPPLALSEYLIGRVAVAIFLPESNGTVDADTEDWSDNEVSQVISETQAALDFWAAQEPRARPTFVRENHFAIPTSYEPISHPQYQDNLWINEMLAYLGYSSGSRVDRLRAYLNDLRSRLQTDWAFAMIIVDSSNDADGGFADGVSSGGLYGGPYLFMTYDNGPYDINNMDWVASHEIAHIFYATDEYDGIVQSAGYLNAADNEGSGCIMDRPLAWCISAGTRLQIGWRDTDNDGILDILDVPPTTTLTEYMPDPTSETQPTYSGSATVVPLTNQNPMGPGNNITISRLVRVEWRVDNGTWSSAQADDGAFDGSAETFSFTSFSLPSGTHIFEARSQNTEGNLDSSYASDWLTVGQGNAPVLAIIGDHAVDEETLLAFLVTATDSDGDPLTFSLGGGSLPGASITSDGLFSWTPSEDQGPSNNTLTIIVSDVSFTDSETVTISVREVNKEPVLATIGNLVVEQGELLTFAVVAFDPDVPAQTLTFSLGPNPPSGAFITSSGLFSWTPTPAQGPGPFALTITVSDGLAINSERVTITVTTRGNLFRETYWLLVLGAIAALVAVVILVRKAILRKRRSVTENQAR